MTIEPTPNGGLALTWTEPMAYHGLIVPMERFTILTAEQVAQLRAALAGIPTPEQSAEIDRLDTVMRQALAANGMTSGPDPRPIREGLTADATTRPC